MGQSSQSPPPPTQLKAVTEFKEHMTHIKHGRCRGARLGPALNWLQTADHCTPLRVHAEHQAFWLCTLH